MDTFCEQLLTIRKTTADWLAILGYFALASLLSCVAIYFLLYFGMIPIVLSLLFLFIAYKLSVRHNIEYEYIVTNGVLDIDKITNRLNRKRLLSFNLNTVTTLEKLNINKIQNVDKKQIIFACNKNDSNAYLMVFQKVGNQPNYLIFSPNEKLKNSMVAFLPKFISLNAFK